MANYVSGSAAKWLLNGQMLGGLQVGADGAFDGLVGGTSGSIAQSALTSGISNNNLVTALNSIYASASGNEPGGDAESVQFRNGGNFGGDASVILDVSAGSLTVNATSGSMGGHLVGFSGSLALDDGDVFSVDNAGALQANSLKTDGDEFVVTTAGAVTSDSSISGSGAGSFGSLILDGAANLQSGGITNAGSIAGATTIAASSTITAEGIVSGAAGTFDALGGTSLALQSGGITAAGAIAGATTIDGSGKMTIGGVSDLDGGIDVNASKFTVSTAGVVVADGTVSGAAGSFDAITGVSLNVQSGGITNAGAVAGATTIDASGKMTIGGVSDLDGGIDVNASNFTVSTAGVVSGAAGSFDAITGVSLNVQSGGITNAGAVAGATTIDASGKMTIGGVSDLDGGIDVNASKFTVSTAGAVNAAGAIISTLGVTGSTGVQGAVLISDGAISGGGNATIAGTVSGSAVTAVAVEAVSYSNDGGQFAVSPIGNLNAAGITGSSVTDGTATLNAAGLSNLALLEFQNNGMIDGHPTGSLQIGNAMVQSTKVTLAGISGSTSLVQAEAARNNVYGDWNMSLGAMYYQGYPNQAAGTFAQSRPALVLSASGFAAQKQTQGNAAAFAAIPYLQLQGVDHAGATQDYKIQISGGILQLNVVT